MDTAQTTASTPSTADQVTHDDMANAIRALAMDAVQKAQSGHPGMPMGMADVATVLFNRFLKFDPNRPDWPDRDRFVLSAGHGSMLLYSLLYLTGYEDMTLEELKNFRQLGSKTAGHPEYGEAGGIETTTGPLGQGLGNSVGMALAERLLNARFGDDLVDHWTYVIASDGDLMEGISHEAASIAGHLGLGRLVVLFDDNGISIDGSTELAAGREFDPSFVESIQFGCVGVTRRAFGKGRITAKRWRRAAAEIETELQALGPQLRRTGWRTAIGSSGTIRAVQAIIAARDDTLPVPIRFEEVEGLRRRLIEFGHVERVSLPGLSGKRQPVIAGGVLVLEACMRAFGIESLQVSPFALREGLLYDMVGRLEQRDPREKTVRAMATRFEADREQAERVRDFALCAFEQIAEAFDLRRIHRDLLDWSCLLHEIGLGIAHSHYQVHSAYVVEHSDMAGFTRQEQQLVAFLLRHQRRKLPEDVLAELPARLRPAAIPMLAILRIAVALARSRSDADLPDFALSAENRQRLRLALPDGWLETHPLSARSLELEKRQLRELGVALGLETLARPHPLGRASG